MNDLISIIVPIYKVEKYLPRCIDSILAQTYKNIEIILVNDGSPDKCGKICDEYKKKDKRIRVIHKENGGLSDARNIGIDIATGEYIAFVDSDDYIESNMYEKLYNIIKLNNADMSICNFICVDEYGNAIDKLNNTNIMQNEVLSGVDVITNKFTKRSSWHWVVAWNKLYKKSLFWNIRFPVGKLHEDEFIAHHIFFNAKKIACCNDIMYFYVQRKDSIMNKKYSVKRLDKCEALLDRIDMGLKNKLDQKTITYFFDLFCGCLYTSYYKIDTKSKEIKKRRNELLRIYKEQYKILILSKCGFKYAMKFTLMCISPYLLYKLSKCKILEKNNEKQEG